MAQGTVKKGFFFYFGLFILLLVAVFMVCLVVMMFNPGATVLWMKYFTANSNTYISQTDDNLTLNYSLVTDLTINCNYANVSVLANNENIYGKGDGIYIINRAKGFAVANGSKNFGYTFKKVGGEYVLDLTEPNGFLFFSKDIQIVLNGHKGTWNLANLNLTINGKEDCDVTLGGTSTIDEKNVSLASATIETEKGDIVFNKTFLTADMGASSFTSNSGKIFAVSNQMNFGGADVTFATNTGRINFENLNAGTKQIHVKNKKGTISVDKVIADQININCTQGNFRFKEVTGTISFADSNDTIISPVIDIDSINGDFFLNATSREEHYKSSPAIKIGNMNGDLIVYALKGSITAKHITGEVDVESSNPDVKGNMNVNIDISADNTNIINVWNQDGNVKVSFRGKVSNNVELRTLSSKIEVYFLSSAKFTAKARNSVDTADLEESKITLSLADMQCEYSSKNNINVNSAGAGDGKISVYTDGKVFYNVVGEIA